jgi:hypothetical protein
VTIVVYNRGAIQKNLLRIAIFPELLYTLLMNARLLAAERSRLLYELLELSPQRSLSRRSGGSTQIFN